jgi:hypothetical protein
VGGQELSDANQGRAMTAPLAQAAHVSQPGRRLRVLGALAGITGPVLLVAYFTAPALVSWPYAGASPSKLIAYATAHRLLFYSGGWLQVTGALLSMVFFTSATGCSPASSRSPRHRWFSPGSDSPCPGPASCPVCLPILRC